MAYRLEPMGEEDAHHIARWRYTGEFAFYNPDASSLDEYAAWLLDPANGYYAVYDETMLVGFCCFGNDAQVPGGDYSLHDALDVGLGLHPGMVGQGRGPAFLSAILSFAQSHYQATCFRATIAHFNKRSQRLFAKAGFQPVQRFRFRKRDDLEFVVVIKRSVTRDTLDEPYADGKEGCWPVHVTGN